jgi:hypothetical protein
VPWRFSAAGRLDAWTGLHSGGRKPAQEQTCQGECELSAKLYCCTDQFSIVRSHSTIRQVNSVLKSNPGREIEAPSLANAEPNAAGFAMQEDRQSAICSIKYREDLMSIAQRLFAITAGYFYQNSQAFFENYLGNKSLSVLAVPKSCFNAYATSNQEVDYLGCIRFAQVNRGIVGFLRPVPNVTVSPLASRHDPSTGPYSNRHSRGSASNRLDGLGNSRRLQCLGAVLCTNVNVKLLGASR